MPRAPIPLIRDGGFREAEKLYVLSYEGKKSEKKYFEDFRHSEYFNNSGLIETVSLERRNDQGSDPKTVKELLEEAKAEFNFQDNDEFWMIIDRDHWEVEHGHNFDDIAKACAVQGNFYMALSNPCFELWLVLHLKDVSDYREEEKVAIMLNEKTGANKHHIDHVLADAIGNGRGYNKRPNPAIFLPNVYAAIARAKALDIGETYPTQLGSHVYKLVEKLVKEQKVERYESE
ncbi:MAG: RloB family protein [Bacteroidia bacterium]